MGERKALVFVDFVDQVAPSRWRRIDGGVFFVGEVARTKIARETSSEGVFSHSSEKLIPKKDLLLKI